jgi:hypothetical protein
MSWWWKYEQSLVAYTRFLNPSQCGRPEFDEKLGARIIGRRTP